MISGTGSSVLRERATIGYSDFSRHIRRDDFRNWLVTAV
jgi:hypothetical protein